jgi:proline dehydrogenase
MAGFLTQLSPRAAAYRLATSDRFERLVRAIPWAEQRAYRAARRYVAGTSLEDALATVRGLRDDGLTASLDLFGEGLTDSGAIGQVVDAYLRAAKEVESLGADVYLEVAPSHLGLDVSADLLRTQLERLLEAMPSESRLQVSAEESWRTGRIIEVVIALGRQGAPVVATVQANLRRSEMDVERLAEAAVPVRLAKGAYLESPDVAYPWGEPTDLAFLRLAHQLRAAGSELAIATHDRVIQEALLAALPGVQIEMLLGVRSQDARELARRGHDVRIYVPYGEEWFRCWMRRVAESVGV